MESLSSIVGSAILSLTKPSHLVSNATNTIHVDDLSRNFALNPGEGLKISAFKKAHTAEAMADRELHKLTKYMVHIAATPDLKTVSHHVWGLRFILLEGLN